MHRTLALICTTISIFIALSVNTNTKDLAQEARPICESCDGHAEKSSDQIEEDISEVYLKSDLTTSLMRAPSSGRSKNIYIKFKLSTYLEKIFIPPKSVLQQNS